LLVLRKLAVGWFASNSQRRYRFGIRLPNDAHE
jgi:hypothetical protein